MNLCFFTDMAALGGGEIWVINAARYLRSRNHQVSVICPYRSDFFAACQKANLDIYSYYSSQGSPFFEPLYYFLKNRRVDVLYCTVIGAFCEARVLEQVLDRVNAERPGNRAALILKTGLPPVPGLTPEYYGAGAGAVVRRLHVVSHDIKRAFRAWQPGLAEGLERFIQVVREGVELSKFDPARYDRAEARRHWEVPEDHKLIVCLARLHPMKGQDNLLLAAREVLKGYPQARFVLAGEGEDRARLEQFSEYLGLSGAVRFAGHVEDTGTLLASADILCHPSLNDGLPNAVVEAIAMEVPIVASRVGGIPEVVRDGVSGLLVPPHDIPGIAKALLELLRKPALAARMGAAARQQIREEFDIESNACSLVGLLEAELEELNRAPASVPAPPAPLVRGATPVLFLMSAIRTGGEETELVILARHLDREAFRLSVLSCWGVDEPAPALEKLARLGLHVDTGCHALPPEEKVRYIVDKIRCEEIRLVVACQDTRLAYEVFQQLSPDERRLIEHGGIPEEVAAIPKDFTTRYVGVSREIVRVAAERMPRKEHALFIPSMVDMTEFQGQDREMLRRAYGFGGDCVVVFVGRLDPKKGLDQLVQAAAEILPRRAGVRFLVVGGRDGYQPEHANQIMRQARGLMDSGRFIFAGARGDVPRILCASDILVLPSRGEGMSHVIQEAGAAGLPVIAADDGAAREQLENGACGRLIPPGRPDLLVQALDELIADADLRRSLGLSLQVRVRREYSAQALVPRWEALFRELTSDLPAPYAPAVLRVIQPDALPPFPREIQIETNTACNATCIMCPYPEVSKELPPGRMTEELYRKILGECGGEETLRRIEPFLNNEPFTDTRLVAWIALAKKMVPQSMVTVTTNGSLLTPAVTDRLIRSGLDAIWFSFNGATKETYEKIMGLSFDKVKRNIDYLLSVRPPTLQVFTNMIETVPMKDEIEENIRRWVSLGVQSGSSPLVNRADNVKNFAELNYRPVSPKPVRLCELLYHKMCIGYNGDVLLCCMDWRRRVVLGNAGRQSLREVWHGEKYAHYRRLHEEGRTGELELCADCSYIHN